MSKLHEECGVFGIYNDQQADLASDCYYALFALQHRGQESAGITVNERGRLRTHKDAGLVEEVFSKDVMSPSSFTAMPQPSCPRCCRAKRP